MANNDIHARKTTEAQLIDRAMKDPAFRAELLADPKAVLARELGLDVPDRIDVQVLVETPNMVYLVLPHAPSASAELSDAELENVAGGAWTNTFGVCGTCDHTCQC